MYQDFSDSSITSVQENNQIYRNPEREDLSENQSLIDRMSRANISDNYEGTSNVNAFGESSAQVPPERGIIKPVLKPHKSVVHIDKFDNLNTRETINNWFKKYELMSEANNWDEVTRKNQLLFHLLFEPNRYCFELLDKNIHICYCELKDKIIDRFTVKDSGSDFRELLNRKFMNEENLSSYWSDKIELIDRVDKTMSFECKCELLIEGLDEEEELYRDVRKFKELREPKTLDDLFLLIRNHYVINKSSQNRQMNIEKPAKRTGRQSLVNREIEEYNNLIDYQNPTDNFNDNYDYYPQEFEEEGPQNYNSHWQEESEEPIDYQYPREDFDDKIDYEYRPTDESYDQNEDLQNYSQFDNY